jgi:hypothetical protein
VRNVSRRHPSHRAANDVEVPHCPSAQPEMPGAVVLGVVGGTAQEPLVSYLSEPVTISMELLQSVAPVNLTEVFRIAAPCAQNLCCHFESGQCGLARRTVQILPTVVEALPACHLRPNCLWWQQEGKSACFRCPQVVTEDRRPDPLVRLAAGPQANRM